MVSRKINTDAIDENLLIASIGKSKIGMTTASILDGASPKPSEGYRRERRGGKETTTLADRQTVNFTQAFQGVFGKL